MKAKLVIALAVALAGCSRDESRSVDWFMEHPVERAEVLALCAEGGADSSSDCPIARKAENAIALKRRGYVKPDPVRFDEEN